MTFLPLLRTAMKQRGLGEGKESGEERLLAGGGAALPVWCCDIFLSALRSGLGRAVRRLSGKGLALGDRQGTAGGPGSQPEGCCRRAQGSASCILIRALLRGPT